jgi:hypothetical protein
MQFINRFIRRRHAWPIISLIIIDLCLFTATNAASVTSFMLIVGFVLLAVTLYYLIYGLLSLAGFYGVAIKQKRRPALYLTFLGGGLIALQSIGELSSRDIAVILPLAVLGYLYVSYAYHQA